jgi:hypothetical protein
MDLKPPLTGLLVGTLLVAGCYEIPPAIPLDYTSSLAALAGRPPAVYAREPFDSRNRWFHRAFGLRGLQGEVQQPQADEPFSTLVRRGPVDHAELRALLERIGSLEEESPRTPPRSLFPRAAVTEAIFVSDVLAEACRLHAAAVTQGPGGDLVPPLIHVARQGVRVELAGLESAPLLRAPPLRDGVWTEEPGPKAPGLLPSTHDPRWTLALRSRARTGDAVLLRFRVALGPGGGPMLLPLASECWEIHQRGTDVTYRVWRFDRAEWLHGRDPWREAAQDDEIRIRNPRDAAQILRARLASLCSSCHSADDVANPPRQGPPFSSVAALSPALLQVQRDLVKQALSWLTES